MVEKHIITKSDLLKYQECPSCFWFSKNLPKVLTEENRNPFTERLISQGYEVELYARGLYPNSNLVQGKLIEASVNTKELIDQGIKELFQASFMVDELFVSCDVLIWNDLFQGWDIIEVKSSTDKEKKSKLLIYDAAFQRIVAQKAGLNIINVYLLELNKNYYKEGDIDLNALFNQSEITTECIQVEQELLFDISDARELLMKSEPTACTCKYKGRSRHCRAFNHLYPNVSNYSIYDLRRIGGSKKLLHELIDGNYIELADIPDDIKLNKKHERQLEVYRSKAVIFEKDKIKSQFDKLHYPLYFLDYETLACAIPKYDKTYPYQQTVFQYSLHILKEDGCLIHKDYIHRDQSTPVHVVAQNLRQDIGDEGNIIVWNKVFESGCHKELAQVNPDLSQFLLGLNERIYDLMGVFDRMEYLHDDFKGKYSIKNVLPVMCPDLSYSDLGVSNGAEAVVVYEELIFGNVSEDEKEDKYNALLKYCELDTLAMVRIFQELEKMINMP